MTTSQATDITKSFNLKHSSTIKSFFYPQGEKERKKEKKKRGEKKGKKKL
jgi:hypothetical protein